MLFLLSNLSVRNVNRHVRTRPTADTHLERIIGNGQRTAAGGRRGGSCRAARDAGSRGSRSAGRRRPARRRVSRPMRSADEKSPRHSPRCDGSAAKSIAGNPDLFLPLDPENLLRAWQACDEGSLSLWAGDGRGRSWTIPETPLVARGSDGCHASHGRPRPGEACWTTGWPEDMPLPPSACEAWHSVLFPRRTCHRSSCLSQYALTTSTSG